MSVFHPTLDEVEEALLRVRHEGTAGGCSLSYYPGPVCCYELPERKMADLLTLAWAFVRLRATAAEVPALAAPLAEELVPLTATGEVADLDDPG